MAAVQMSIRDTALELEAVDSLACATMVESKAAATRAMRALPNAFECLTDPDTATAAQPIFEEIAADAQRVEKLFFSVGLWYMFQPCLVCSPCWLLRYSPAVLTQCRHDVDESSDGVTPTNVA